MAKAANKKKNYVRTVAAMREYANENGILTEEMLPRKIRYLDIQVTGCRPAKGKLTENAEDLLDFCFPPQMRKLLERQQPDSTKILRAHTFVVKKNRLRLYPLLELLDSARVKLLNQIEGATLRLAIVRVGSEGKRMVAVAGLKLPRDTKWEWNRFGKTWSN